MESTSDTAIKPLPDFSNRQLWQQDIPAAEQVMMEQLDARYKKILWMNITLQALIFLITSSVVFVVFFEKRIGGLIVFLPFTIWLGIRLITFNKVFTRKKYALREHDLIYQSGLIFKHRQIVPHNRIQHISIQESWLARHYGLASITAFTTGGAITIPGLDKNSALNIEALMLSKINQLNRTETAQNSEENPEESQD